MSENSNSSGSGNSWTVLTPEEPAVESVGSGVEGTEIVTNAPVLAEEVTGSVTVSETGDSMVETGGVHFEERLQFQEPAVENVGPGTEGAAILTDTPLLAAGVTGSVTEPETGDRMVQTGGLRSEEGLQVCQETLSDSPRGSPPPSPTLLSPTPSTHMSLSSSSFSPDPDTFSDTYTHISSFPESHISTSSYPESIVSVPTTTSLEGEGIQQEEEKSELAKKVTEVGKQAEPSGDSELGEERGTEGDGLRKRKVFPIGPLDQQGDEDQELLRPRDGEEDGGGFPLNKCILGALILLGLGTILFSVDDVDVRELSDAELHGSQEWLNSEANPQGAQENAELLDKLAKENEQIIALQAQLQAQKEELNTALQQAEERARESAWKGELEKENERMKQELSSLPSLQSELETLRARVMELTLLTAKEESQQAPVSPSAPPPSDQTESGNQSGVVEETTGGTGETRDGGSLTEELERQKVLLEESRKRLEGMKVEGGRKTGVREGLAEMERRLTEEVEKLGRRGGERRRKEWKVEKEWKQGRDSEKYENKEWKERELKNEWRGGKEWKQGRERGREDGKDWRDRDERKEWKAEKEWKKGKDGGRDEGKEWKNKEERKEWKAEKIWKLGRDAEKDKGKEWKERDERKWLSRDGWKEGRKDGDWKKHKDHHKHERESRNGNKDEGTWEQKERSKKERHWQATADKTPLDPSHRHHEHNEYWKKKREKLQHFYRPLVDCNGIAECAKREGLSPVNLADFEALLGGYLSKLEATEVRGKEEISKLIKEFFVDGVFTHDKISFRDFVEDVADILEDMVEGEGEEDEEREEEMEEFEKEALKKFSVTGGEGEDDIGGDWKRGNGRVRG
ncbi:pre-B-cell leukemia homeobox interacting protein 1b isoform X2 [Megalops cyprinoides]|uniref:pre-B-cell leukemia homeobox interacting protein 1b isoform X2 n=1 Tax=Megalops cyprinoides TaxID=118141 RepID=UPI0018655486|nr:pre-B-cell leukemia homeobox interacting protein 1b isoform X2 [Megalops cyprinoides]